MIGASGLDTSHGSGTQTTSVPLTSEYPFARVDLLPPEILADRRFARARGWMALAVVGTVLLTGGVYALASNDADQAAAELVLEQARTTELNAEAAQYAAVPAILAGVDRAETALQTAMVTDVEWYRYLSQLATVTPDGVWFTTMTLTTAQPGLQPAGDPLAPVDVAGDVTTVGRALTYDHVATWMDQVESVSGVDHALVGTTTLTTDTATEPFVEFQVTAKLLAEAYSDRYVAKGE